MKNGAVTLKDVAEAAGCSPTAVSMVLNDAPLARYISAETKNRIRKVAKRLDYRPNAFARTLRRQRSRTVGVLVCDMTDPYCTLILRGVEAALTESSYLPVLMDFHNDSTRFEANLDTLLNQRVEGLIVVANWLFLDINLLADLEQRRVATVVIGRQIPPHCSVTVDNVAGARSALTYLYEQGHREIAFIRGPQAVVDTAERWAGINTAARELGLALDSELIVDLPELQDAWTGFEGGERLTAQLLSRGRRFTAIMAFDDLTAFGTIRALEHGGLRVPEQCSVIGFDDVPAAALYNPALTTVRQPMQAMGATAVEMVMEQLKIGAKQGRQKTKEHRALPELVLRETTAAVSR